MSQFVEVKTAELAGPALDWVVANTQKGVWPVVVGGKVYHDTDWEHIPYSPSTDWARGGPLIDKYCSALNKSDTGWWAHAGDRLGEGDTALVTLCRAIVAAKLGDVVQVPAELAGVR